MIGAGRLTSISSAPVEFALINWLSFVAVCILSTLLGVNPKYCVRSSPSSLTIPAPLLRDWSCNEAASSWISSLLDWIEASGTTTKAGLGGLCCCCCCCSDLSYYQITEISCILHLYVVIILYRLQTSTIDRHSSGVSPKWTSTVVISGATLTIRFGVCWSLDETMDVADNRSMAHLLILLSDGWLLSIMKPCTSVLCFFLPKCISCSIRFHFSIANVRS